MKPTITKQKRIGTYFENENPKRKVEMRHGTLTEFRGGKHMHRPVFFYMRNGSPVIVMRHELARNWSPVFGSHACGDQHNKHPDLFARIGVDQCANK